MDLYLIRHADAIDADSGMTDAERPLSEDGQEKMRKGAKGLRNLLSGNFPPIDAILTSPLLRALESARIIASMVNEDDTVVECPPLAEGSKWEALLPFLSKYPNTSRIALVGHEPDLGALAGWLLAPGSGASFSLKKGSAVCFEIEEVTAEPEAELLWFLTPKQLRMLR